MEYGLIFIAALLFFTGLWKLLDVIFDKVTDVRSMKQADQARETLIQQNKHKEQSK